MGLFDEYQYQPLLSAPERVGEEDALMVEPSPFVERTIPQVAFISGVFISYPSGEQVWVPVRTWSHPS
jgi:hypothetical protein